MRRACDNRSVGGGKNIRPAGWFALCDEGLKGEAWAPSLSGAGGPPRRLGKR